MYHKNKYQSYLLIKKMDHTRYLIEDEIFDIVSSLPKSTSPFKEVSECITRCLMINLEKALRRYKIDPIGIPLLKQLIYSSMIRSRSIPGTPCGVLAATALGNPITQMTLNSKRAAGAKKLVGSSFSRLVELTNISDTKYPITTICTTFPICLYDILNFRIKFNEITFADIITEVNLIDNEQFISNDWVKLYFQIFNKQIPLNNYNILEIKLNVNKLIKNRIRMYQLREIIYSKSNTYKLDCVFSPLSIGVIHIIPNKQAILDAILEKLEGTTFGMDPMMLDSFFFNSVYVPELKMLNIKGISGIKEANSIEIPYTNFIDEEILFDKNSNIWDIYTDPILYNNYNITIDNFANLFKASNIKYLSVRYDNYKSGKYNYANYPIIFRVECDEIPSIRINKARQEYNKLIEKRYDEGDLSAFAEINPFMYMYIETMGTNIDELIRLKFVDSKHLYTNCVKTMERNYGISVRDVLLNEMIELIDYTGSYINPKHIRLLIDMMVNLGFANKITIIGMIAKDALPLDVATYERAAKILTQEAAFSRTQPTTTVSTSILLGLKGQFGSGYSKISIDKEKYEQYLKDFSKLERTKRLEILKTEGINIKDALDSLLEEPFRPTLSELSKEFKLDAPPDVKIKMDFDKKNQEPKKDTETKKTYIPVKKVTSSDKEIVKSMFKNISINDKIQVISVQPSILPKNNDILMSSEIGSKLEDDGKIKIDISSLTTEKIDQSMTVNDFVSNIHDTSVERTGSPFTFSILPPEQLQSNFYSSIIDKHRHEKKETHEISSDKEQSIPTYSLPTLNPVKPNKMIPLGISMNITRPAEAEKQDKIIEEEFDIPIIDQNFTPIEISTKKKKRDV